MEALPVFALLIIVVILVILLYVFAPSKKKEKDDGNNSSAGENSGQSNGTGIAQAQIPARPSVVSQVVPGSNLQQPQQAAAASATPTAGSKPTITLPMDIPSDNVQYLSSEDAMIVSISNLTIPMRHQIQVTYVRTDLPIEQRQKVVNQLTKKGPMDESVVYIDTNSVDEFTVLRVQAVEYT